MDLRDPGRNKQNRNSQTLAVFPRRSAKGVPGENSQGVSGGANGVKPLCAGHTSETTVVGDGIAGREFSLSVQDCFEPRSW